MIKKFIILLFVILFSSFLIYFLTYTDNIKKPKVEIATIKNTVPTPSPEPTITINPVTLDSIFNSKPDLNKYPKENITTLIATGDFIPARSVNFQTLKYKNFLWPVDKVIPYFEKSDIVFVNLEAPLLDKCPITNEGFVFCGQKGHIDALKAINTSIVNLANNHFSNYGTLGITESEKVLTENNIKYTGANNLEIIEKNGIKFGFLGYNDIGYTPEEISKAIDTEITEDITISKEKCDVLIVTFHFGAEYNYLPDDRQKELAHLAIDSGADLIIGNHPHTIQPVEIYKEKLIMYAHGNFVFDQMWSEQTKQGVIGYYSFYKNKLVSVSFKPVYIQDYGQAIIPEETLGNSIISKLREISFEWEKKIIENR